MGATTITSYGETQAADRHQPQENTMKKYELTSESIVHLGKTLYRIKALVSFGSVGGNACAERVNKERMEGVA